MCGVGIVTIGRHSSATSSCNKFSQAFDYPLTQSLEAFQPLIALQGERDAAFRRSIYEQLLDAIATHSVADRPNRFEPRLRKRRRKKYDRMMKPRHGIKRDILKRLKEN